jgi:uncharacterized paraquat-inducible protein A
MAVVGWKKIYCPGCKGEFTNREIALMHFTKVCPDCHTHIDIDAYKSLQETEDASVLAVIFLGIYGGVLFGLVKSLEGWGGLEISIIYAALIILGIPAGAFSASMVVKRFAKFMIARAKKKLEKTGQWSPM